MRFSAGTVFYAATIGISFIEPGAALAVQFALADTATEQEQAAKQVLTELDKLQADDAEFERLSFPITSALNMTPRCAALR